MSQIYFIRHAQASYMQEDYDQLSPHGKKQSEALGHFLQRNEVHFDQIFVGLLRRQQQTLQIVADVYTSHQSAFVQPILLPELAEHAGPEALQFLQASLAVSNPQIKHWAEEIMANPALKKRNSLLIFEYFMRHWATGQITEADHLYEPWAAFRKRVKQGIELIISTIDKGQTVGVFTSGGVVAAAVAESLGIEDETKVAGLNYTVRNTSLTQFRLLKNNLSLVAFNEIPHLSKEMVTFV
jgi:broad specificity phosphatase PhoE